MMPFIKQRITVFVPRVLTVSYLRVAENGRIIAVSPHKKDDRAAVNEKQQWKDKQKIGLFNIGNNSRIGERDQLLDRSKREENHHRANHNQEKCDPVNTSVQNRKRRSVRLIRFLAVSIHSISPLNP